MMNDDGWDNLGDWSTGEASYVEAAGALAERLWSMCGTRPHARVLDLGCGFGAQLRLWRRLGAGHVLAFEPDTQRAARAGAQNADDENIEVHIASAASLHEVPTSTIDAVLVLDALYHVRRRAEFFGQARRAVRDDGCLAFCTLVAPPHRQFTVAVVSAVGRGFEMPDGVPTEASLRRELSYAGFGELSVEDWSVDVLGGFARHGGRCVGPRTPLRRRARVAATRWGCRTALALGVRYVGVCAR